MLPTYLPSIDGSVFLASILLALIKGSVEKADLL